MIKINKREEFIKRLNISKVKKTKPLELNVHSMKVDKSLEMDKLFNGLKKKYKIGSQKSFEHVKMEFKKFYD